MQLASPTHLEGLDLSPMILLFEIAAARQVCGDPGAHQRPAFPQEFGNNGGESCPNHTICRPENASIKTQLPP